MSETKTVTVSLSKALKYKNDVINRFNVVSNLIKKHNSYDIRNRPKFDIALLYGEMTRLSAAIAEIKTAIAQANSPIQPQLNKQAELRSFSTVLDSIPTTEGAHNETNYGGGDPIVVVTKAEISEEDIVATKRQISAQISDLQDQIDQFNATTKVTLPFVQL